MLQMWFNSKQQIRVGYVIASFLLHVKTVHPIGKITENDSLGSSGSVQCLFNIGSRQNLLFLVSAKMQIVGHDFCVECADGRIHNNQFCGSHGLPKYPHAFLV